VWTQRYFGSSGLINGTKVSFKFVLAMFALTKKPFRLGLSGGIGSGKSTVAARFLALGAAVIDADAISRNTTATGGEALPAIVHAFGPSAIGSDGAMDRAAIRQTIFNDPQAKLTLERIIHPLVAQAIKAQTAQAITRGYPLIVFDIPLLVESPRWRTQVDAVLIIDCEQETQIARVIARSGLSRDAVLAVIKTQATRMQRLTAADTAILNDGITLGLLHAQVDNLIGQLRL
jgi:dephospho-CoA kinase